MSYEQRCIAFLDRARYLDAEGFHGSADALRDAVALIKKQQAVIRKLASQELTLDEARELAE